MEHGDEKLISALNDLVKINNHRIERYKRVILLTDNEQLKSIFHDIALQSSKNIDELTDRIFLLGESISEGTSHEGQIYRGWMALEAAIAGNDEYSLLAECETEEESILKSYQKIILNKGDFKLDVETNRLLEKHIQIIGLEKEKIREVRNTC